MSSDIKGIGPTLPPVTEARRHGRTQGREGGGSSQPGAAGAAGDRVELAAPALLAETRRRIDETPVVDRGRVEAVRAAIAEGRYEIRPERIAERLLAMERLLGPGEKDR